MSETRVVHIRDADLSDPNTVYIGRPMPRQRLKGSVWANPFRIDAGCSREMAIEKYRLWLQAQPQLLTRVGELCGKTLACWCAPKGGVTAADSLICHGQILASAAAEQSGDSHSDSKG